MSYYLELLIMLWSSILFSPEETERLLTFEENLSIW